MRILIPISANDNLKDPTTGNPQRADFDSVRDLVELQVNLLTRLGGLGQHHILIVPTPSQERIGLEMAEALRPHCPNTKCAVLDNEGMAYEPQDPWPVSPNNHFSLAASMQAREKDKMPWVWYEMDTFATQQSPWDRLAVGYQNAREAVMGFIRDCEFVDMAQNRRRVAGDDYMLGVAVYSPWVGSTDIRPPMNTDKSEDANFRRAMLNLRVDLVEYRMPGDPAKDPRVAGEPFDIGLRKAFKRCGRAHTRMIADQWNTYNYRLNDKGQLVCDAGPTRGTGRPRGGIVDPEAILVHGCKDGTGHRLALEDKIPKTLWVADTPEARLRSQFPPDNGKGGGPNELLKVIAEMQAASEERMMRMIMMLKPEVQTNGNGHHAPIEAPAPQFEDDGSARAQFEADQAERLRVMQSKLTVAQLPQAPDADEVLEYMAGKSVTTKKLSEHLGLDQEMTKAFILAHPNKFDLETKSPAAWIKPKLEMTMA